LTVTGGTIADNSAADGGAIYAADAFLTLTRVTIARNTATGNGGAVYADAGLQQTGGKIIGNTAGGNGGGVWVPGGLILTDATFAITGTVLAANTATDGGALYNQGDTLVTLTRVKIVRNHATADGGGVFGDTASVIALDSSLVAANTAAGHGGGIAMEANIRGLSDYGQAAELSGTPVRRNTATVDGGGIWSPPGAATLDSSPVTGNKPDNCAPPGTVTGCTG
jgi:predicted outer membrane repeat protein